MPQIPTTGDLKTHIYPDLIEEIVRGDESIAPKAIKAAMAQIKSYLSKYDLTKLFSDQIEDENLTDKVKDVACWKLVKLANPNIDLTLFKDAYKEAVDWFKDVRDGNADPEGWPYKENDTTTEGFDEASQIGWSSNRKRQNHF